MIVSDYLPLSIVEGEGFQNLMKVVAPDYDIPCRKTIRARITKCYEEQKTVLFLNKNTFPLSASD